jgi:hypothetical protein
MCARADTSVEEDAVRRSAVMTSAVVAGLAAVALSVGSAAGSSSAPRTIVYDTTSVTHQLVFPRGGHGLSPARGALRQDPGTGGMFARGNNAAYRVSKISGARLSRMSTAAMVSALEGQIRRGQYGAQAHLVAIDELMETYADPHSGRTSPGIGTRFTGAMRILASAQSPWGGTWASRVQVYVSPGIVSSIAIGYGPDHNRSPSGRVQYRSWRGVMPGLALAGGLHLEMYHGNGTGFSASLWRRAPHAFLDLLHRYGGSASTVHFVMSATSRPAGASRGWGGAMTTTWSLARSTPAGRTILANGPDAYRLGRQAAEWLKQYNRQFPN